MHDTQYFFATLQETRLWVKVSADFPETLRPSIWLGIKQSVHVDCFLPICSLRPSIITIQTGTPGFLSSFHGLTLILIWLSNYIHCKVWDEITYPFSNFNGTTIRVWEQRKFGNGLVISYSTLYAPVTSHSRAPYGLSQAVPGLFWTKNRYVFARGTYGVRAGPYEFCLPYAACRVLMQAL